MEHLLTKAARDRKQVEIIYEAKNKKLSQRLVTVYTLTTTHLFCFCHLKQAFRAFSIEQILSCSNVQDNSNKNRFNL